MILKDISFVDPNENVLYDDVLLRMAEYGKGQEVLRFWESQSLFIVLGRVSNVDEDVKGEETKRDNIPILRRSSGGGTVLQGKGCLNYSLILSKKNTPEIRDLKKSYYYILGNVVKALKRLDIEADFFPISDIALSSSKKKISGNAQRRLREFILHHGTILYDFDISLIERYLTIPKDVPEYRLNRSHSEFVDNIKIDVNDFKKELKKIFNIELEEKRLNKDESEYLSNIYGLKV